MSAGIYNHDELIAILLRDLAASLEDRDSEAQRVAEATWAERSANPRGRHYDTERSFLVAHAHQSRCQKGQANKCICCALVQSIFFCCMVDDDKPAREFVEAVGAAIRKLAAVQRDLTKAVEKFKTADAPVVKALGKYVSDHDLARQLVLPMVPNALDRPLRFLREIPGLVLPQGIYEGMLPWLCGKRGRRPQAIVDFIADYLKTETGLTDKDVGELMGMGKDSIKRRRRRTKTA